MLCKNLKDSYPGVGSTSFELFSGLRPTYSLLVYVKKIFRNKTNGHIVEFKIQDNPMNPSPINSGGWKHHNKPNEAQPRPIGQISQCGFECYIRQGQFLKTMHVETKFLQHSDVE